jgi:hypothetical protein
LTLSTDDAVLIEVDSGDEIFEHWYFSGGVRTCIFFSNYKNLSQSSYQAFLSHLSNELFPDT